MEGMGEQMSRCVIVGASPFFDAAALAAYLRDDDYIIAADGGSALLTAMARQPQYRIGDFDSSAAPCDSTVPCDRLPTHKDDTDVFAAAKLALAKGYREFLLLGCLGGRLDHTVSNLFLLRFLHEHGATGTLADECHEVTLLGKGTHTVLPRKGYYLLLLPYGGNAQGVTIVGAEYPLENATLDTVFPLGVSNGFLDSPVSITVKSGFLLQILAKKE